MVSVSDDPVLEQARVLAGNVPDPEIPVVTLQDLGILRSVHREGDHIVVMLTPTYTGCPATEVIREDVQRTLAHAGVSDVQVRLTLSPPWSSDWISPHGRQKLRDYGIAPPACGADADQHAGALTSGSVLRFMPRDALTGPACPRCDSVRIERISQYGSTPCKALYRCLACREPFDYFKPY